MTSDSFMRSLYARKVRGRRKASDRKAALDSRKASIAAQQRRAGASFSSSSRKTGMAGRVRRKESA
jgi:hypothetical protein